MSISGLSGLRGISAEVLIPGTITKTCGTAACLSNAYTFSTGTFSVVWNNPNNVGHCNTATVATASLAGGNTSQYLIASNFDFSSIPGNARIDGITVTWNLEPSAGSGFQDASCVLFSNASTLPTIISNDLGVGTHTFTPSGVFNNFVYGSSTNNWGLASNNNLGSTLQNICDFGVGLSATRTGISGARAFNAACCTMQVNYTY